MTGGCMRVTGRLVITLTVILLTCPGWQASTPRPDEAPILIAYAERT